MDHQCKDCGSTNILADRQLNGRLTCRNCGSFKIGWKNKAAKGRSGVIHPFKENQVNAVDYQYLIVGGILIAIWFGTDLLGLVDKSEWMSLSGAMLAQPHRFITSTLIHEDAKHLLLNLGGIVFARYILMELGMKNRYFFFLLVGLLIPASSGLQWTWEKLIVGNQNAASLGFSGVIYGIDSFLLLASIKGKDRFLGSKINLRKNSQIKQTMVAITIIGQIWNFIGNVSIVGHQSGLIAGFILFLV